MMFQDSFFDNHFQNLNYVLKKYRDGKKATLRASYSVENGAYFTVSDEALMTMTYSCNPDTVEEMEKFFGTLEQEFNTVIPVLILAQSEEFLSLLPYAFTVDLELNNSSGLTLCKICGDFDTIHFRGAYFPGFGVHTDAIEVFYGMDCHPISKKYAVSVNDEDMGQVFDILDYIINIVAYGDDQEALESFRDRLQLVVQASKAKV